MADLPGFGTNWGSFSNLGMLQYGERVHNAFLGFGFNTNEQLGGIPGTRLTPIYGLLNPGQGDGGQSPDGVIRVNTDWGIIGYEWAANDSWELTNLFDDDWWAPQRQTQNEEEKVALTESQLDRIREQIPNTLTDKCADFINRLMRAHTGNEGFDAKKDLLDTFDYVRKQAPEYGFKWYSGNYAGKKEITFARPERGFSGVMRGLSILTVIHELIHTAGVNAGRDSSDNDLSRTVHELGIEVKDQRGNVLKYGPDPKFPNDIGYKWYWGVALRERCPEVYDSTIF